MLKSIRFWTVIKGLQYFGVGLYGYDPLLSLKQINEFNVKAVDDLVTKDFIILGLKIKVFGSVYSLGKN